MTIGPAGDIDFAGNTLPQPLFLFFFRNPADTSHFANEFMSCDAMKIVIAAQDFHIRVADSRQADANECPTRS
jgi:hypothetical protein